MSREDSDAGANLEAESGYAMCVVPHSYVTAKITGVTRGVTCSCGSPVTGKAKRCRPCQRAYVKSRRDSLKAEQPRIVVAVVTLEDTETGKDVYVVCGAPNDAAIAAGWKDKTWGPYKTMGGAQRKAQLVSEALDAWAEEPRA